MKHALTLLGYFVFALLVGMFFAAWLADNWKGWAQLGFIAGILCLWALYGRQRHQDMQKREWLELARDGNGHLSQTPGSLRSSDGNKPSDHVQAGLDHVRDHRRPGATWLTLSRPRPANVLRRWWIGRTLSQR
jgi:hypothetical protein